MLSHSRFRRGGFSVTEVLVTISLSSIFFTAAALVFQNISANQKVLSTIETIQLGATTAESEAVIQNLYGLTSQSTIQVYSAPNFGRAALADNLAENFYDDVAAASGVFVLARNGLNTMRPTLLDYDEATIGPLDSPEAFRSVLLANDATAAAVFVEYQGATSHAFDPTTGAAITDPDDLSVFIISPFTASQVSIVAVYDLDLIPVTNGTYAAVRRYQADLVTAYYDVLFESGTGDAFSPLAVFFSRRGLAPTETNTTKSRFMVAEEHPFYLMWWPDPAMRTLANPTHATPPNPSAPVGSAVWDYYRMGGRTRYLFTFPAFPALQ